MKVVMLVIAMVASFAVQAQSNIVAKLEINGIVATEGEGPIAIAGVDTTDFAIVFNYSWVGEVNTGSTSQAAERVRYGALRLVKPIGASSVYLRQALDENQRIDGDIKVFAPNPGDGTTTEIYNIEVLQGRVVGIRPFLDGTTNQYLEEVQIAPVVIEFTDVQSGISHTIDLVTAL